MVSSRHSSLFAWAALRRRGTYRVPRSNVLDGGNACGQRALPIGPPVTRRAFRREKALALSSVEKETATCRTADGFERRILPTHCHRRRHHERFIVPFQGA